MIALSGTLSDSTRSLTLRGRIGYRKENEKKRDKKEKGWGGGGSVLVYTADQKGNVSTGGI